MALTPLEPEQIAAALETCPTGGGTRAHWPRRTRPAACRRRWSWSRPSEPPLDRPTTIPTWTSATGTSSCRRRRTPPGTGWTGRDTALAARISALAAQRGVRAVPADARTYEIGVDASDPAALAQTWAVAFGYRVGPQQDEVTDPFGRGPTVWFQRTDTPCASRLHLDVHVADELQDQTVAAIGTSGGRTLDTSYAPSFCRRRRPRRQPVLHLHPARG